MKTVKWVFVPLALIVAGYMVVGPYASDYLNRSKAQEAAASKK